MCGLRTMVQFEKVLVSLLARAYAAEFSEEEVISEILMQVSEVHFWEALFGVLKDSEMHRQMIEEIITLLQFDVKDFKEYSARTVSVRSYEFSKDFLSKMLEEVLKIEMWCVNYYSNLLKLDFTSISQEYGNDVVAKIKDTLQKLVKWEENHVKIVQELQSKF
jgi:hypothetical protein